MHHITLGFTLLTACVLLPATAMSAANGHVFTFAGTNGASEILLGPGYGVVIETPAGPNGRGAGRFIFVQGPPPELRMIDDDRQSFFVMNEETVRALAERMAQLQSQFGGMRPPGGAPAGGISGLPPDAMKKLQEVQAAMRQSRQMRTGASAGETSGTPTGPIELRKTNERATHAGHPCVKHEAWRDGVKVREYWVTEWRNVPGGSQMQTMVAELQRAYAQIMGGFRETMEGGMKAKPGGDAFETWTKLEGFPVVTRKFATDRLVEESTLQSSEQRRLAPADFQPDPTYKPQDMFATPSGG